MKRFDNMRCNKLKITSQCRYFIVVTGILEQALFSINKKNAPHDIVVDEVSGVFDEIEKYLEKHDDEAVLTDTSPFAWSESWVVTATISPMNLLREQATGRIEIW